jgi:hypothetical protein
MTERTTLKEVTFRHPFFLSGEDRIQPAGTYQIKTVGEQIAGLSFVACRRISTTITLSGPNPALRQVMEIDPTDLEAAINADSQVMKT